MSYINIDDTNFINDINNRKEFIENNPKEFCDFFENKQI